MTQAITYVRFSTKAQDKGSTLDRQQTAIAGMCKARGWDVIEQIEDLGRSAWRGDHLRSGNLGKFKDRVDAGDIPAGTVLVVENVDRLSRENVKKARRWIEEVTEAGILVAVCSPEKVFDEASLSGENIIDLLSYLLEAQRSHQESVRKSGLIAGKWRSAQKDAVDTGRLVTLSVPAWISVDAERRPHLIPERQAIVQLIYQLCADGMGYWSIAKHLNERDVPPWGGKRNSSELWEWSYIRLILKAATVEGEYRPKVNRGETGEVVEGYYPRAVSAELVARARAAQSTRSRTGGSNYREPKNLFPGLTVCGVCRGVMVRRSKGRDPDAPSYLQCYAASRGGKCAHTTFWRYDIFEREALEIVLKLALQNQFFKRSDESAILVNELANLRKKLGTREANQQRLLNYVMENDDATEATARLRDLRTEVAEIKNEVENIEQSLLRARGQVSHEEHVARVLAVSNALEAEDDQVRAEARIAVKEAIANVVELVTFDPVDKIGDRVLRTATILMGGQLAGFKLDHEGAYLGGWSFAGEMTRDELTGPALREAFQNNTSTRVAGNVDAIAARDVAAR